MSNCSMLCMTSAERVSPNEAPFSERHTSCEGPLLLCPKVEPGSCRDISASAPLIAWATEQGTQVQTKPYRPRVSGKTLSIELCSSESLSFGWQFSVPIVTDQSHSRRRSRMQPAYTIRCSSFTSFLFLLWRRCPAPFLGGFLLSIFRLFFLLRFNPA